MIAPSFPRNDRIPSLKRATDFLVRGFLTPEVDLQHIRGAPVALGFCLTGGMFFPIIPGIMAFGSRNLHLALSKGPETWSPSNASKPSRSLATISEIPVVTNVAAKPPGHD